MNYENILWFFGTTIGIIVLIVIVIIVLLFIGGIVVAIVVPTVIRKENKKYRDFVTSNSFRLKEVDEINKSFNFIKINGVFLIKKQVDNRNAFYKTEPVDLFVKLLRDDYKRWCDLKDKIDFNRDLALKYDFKIESLPNHLSKKTCTDAGLDYVRCYQLEKEMCDAKRLKPVTNVLFRVTLSYQSPKQRVTSHKNEDFRYTEFIRALDSVSSRRMDRATYESYVAAERAILSDSMRYDVMRRDGFKCVLCGATAADGAKLHVDHIYPVSKGGKTVMSNLRTLCERCNMGKSNKIE